jgi:hypothetical protein
MASSILTRSHAATKTQPIPEHRLFVASLVHGRGSLGSQIDGFSLCSRLPGPIDPGLRYEVEISASYQELALHRNTCKCAPGGYSIARSFNQGFSTFLHLFCIGSTLTFGYCLCNITACGTYVSIPTSTHGLELTPWTRVSAANERRCSSRARRPVYG